MQGAAPLAATRRSPGLPTEGGEIAAAAELVGTPLLPWQAYAADIIGERLPSGEYAHQVVVVSVPRQSGKTTLLRAVGIQRALLNRRSSFYTAQTGKDARARWEDLVEAVEDSPLKGLVKVRRSAGSERVDFPGGASFHAFAPTASALHGYTPGTVMLDEAFAHSEQTGKLLMGAIGPAQLTVTDRQLLIVSTAGTAESTWFHDLLDRATAGDTPRMAGLLWAATEEQDPFALETIRAIHPGVGFVLNGRTIQPEDILGAVEREGRSEYERAYLNRRTRTTAHTVPPETWRPLELAVMPAAPDPRHVVLSYDLAAGGKAAAIVATWVHDGRPLSRVVMAAAGWEWVAPQVIDLARTMRPRAVVAHDADPVRSVTEAVERAGVTVTKIGPAAWTTASGEVLRLIRSGGLRHDGAKVLEHAWSGVGLRPSGDGVALSRRLSVGDSSPAFAQAAGVWGLDRTRARPKPSLYVPGGAA